MRPMLVLEHIFPPDQYESLPKDSLDFHTPFEKVVLPAHGKEHIYIYIIIYIIIYI